MTSKLNSTPRLEKIKRIREGNPPRILDLFAGCGGFSLGFQSAGFEIVGGVELDKHAARTHATNFFENGHAIDHHSKPRDIRETEPQDVLEQSPGSIESTVDVIVGGPPCQSYARVGRAKLREIDEHPEAFLEDSRGNLYLRYLHYVRALNPLAVVIENVPDVLNYGGHNIAEEIAEVLTGLGYTCGYTLLNSAFYGVPQMRERMFLIGYADELSAEVAFPNPSHWIELPPGYKGSRDVALKVVRSGSLFEDKAGHFHHPPQASPELPPARTAEEALCDLPEISRHLNGNLKRGARRFDELVPYPEKAEQSEYSMLMRGWRGFENEEGVWDHNGAIRYLPRDYEIFKRMEPGDQYPEAHKKARDMLRERLLEIYDEHGILIYPGSPYYSKYESKIVPPYDPSKFPNKWRKMEPDEPARTLMAHLGKDSYSHIHYDSDQARTISVREAARLQSFPDGFKFSGTMNPAFRQIGNAVPPLLAHAIATRVAQALNFNATSVLSQTDTHARV